jgi:DNA primase
MPLEWDEVDDGLDPKNFTIRNALERMESLGEDPCADVLTDKPKLAKVLEKLAALLQS